MEKKPIVAAGKTSIKQAAAILEKSDVLVCDDSGLMHMSVAVGTPVIAIFGPTDHTRTAPYGKEHIIVQKDLECIPCSKIDMDPKKRIRTDLCPYDNRCIKDITVDEIYNIIKERFLK
jgi:ADP-heptose:LPS heptosyltransferase